MNKRMKTKTLFTAAVVLMTALVFAECGEKNPLEGSWVSKSGDGSPNVIIFVGDKVLLEGWSFLSYTYNNGIGSIDDDGYARPFKVKGSTLTLDDKVEYVKSKAPPNALKGRWVGNWIGNWSGAKVEQLTVDFVDDQKVTMTVDSDTEVYSYTFSEGKGTFDDGSFTLKGDVLTLMHDKAKGPIELKRK